MDFTDDLFCWGGGYPSYNQVVWVRSSAEG